MNANELLTDDSMKTYYMKTSKTSLSQIPVRKFVGSLNLKIPAVKIYSFQNTAESAQRKAVTSLPLLDDRTHSKSAKVESVQPPEKLDSNSPIKEGYSMATNTKQKPMSGGFSEAKMLNKPNGKCLVMRNYKGLQEKINPLKKNAMNSSKNEGKGQSSEKEKPKTLDENKEKKRVGIDTLKGIMLEPVGGIGLEGFSESTIKIDQEGDFMVESQMDILEMLENGLTKK